MKTNTLLVFAVVSVAAVENGYIASVLGATLLNNLPLEASIAENPAELNFTFAKYLTLGHILGLGILGLLSPYANKIGRKKALFWTNALLPVALTLQVVGANVWSPFLTILGQVIAGIQTELLFCLCLLYVFETSPWHQRGTRVCAFLFIQELWAVILEAAVEELVRDENGSNFHWEWLLAAALIPAGMFIDMLRFCPEPFKDDIQDVYFQRQELKTSPIGFGFCLLLLFFWFLLCSIIRVWQIGGGSFDDIAVLECILIMMASSVVTAGIVDLFPRRPLLFTACSILFGLNFVEVISAIFMPEDGVTQIPKAIVNIWRLTAFVGTIFTTIFGFLVYVILLELGDQKSRAKVLVVPHVLVAGIIGVVAFGIQLLQAEGFRTRVLFGYGAEGCFGVVIFAVWWLWKKLPETRKTSGRISLVIVT